MEEEAKAEEEAEVEANITSLIYREAIDFTTIDCIRLHFVCLVKRKIFCWNYVRVQRQFDSLKFNAEANYVNLNRNWTLAYKRAGKASIRVFLEK